ncbi:MAG: outer membrane lipoprotein-sorting protein [Elusimicrobia bacterium]|nr:outer membrane lipoprotein-sorting protein [Elusimicrobiota bacterium]
MRISQFLSVFLASVASVASLASFAGAVTAKDIVDKANKVLRGDSNHAVITMTIVTPSWTRSLDIEGWNRDRQEALILIHAPPKDKGTTTLRLKKEMWLYKPEVERVIKIPPTMMHSSWMGSDFTYEDIVKADSIVKDYTHKIVGSKKEKDWDYYDIEALPKPDAPVVWGRIILSGRVYSDGTVIPMIEKDYSERGELIRTMEMSDIQKMGGRRVPTLLTCISNKKPGQKTVLKYHKIEFDVKFPQNFFSLARLQKGIK